MDLRNEFADLISLTEGVGRWVVLRHFSEEHSEFWKPETSEAVGGPAYTYTDVVVECYSAPVSRSITIDEVNTQVPASIDESNDRFFFKYGADIKINDEIFDLEYYKAEMPTVVLNIEDEDIVNKKVTRKTRYKIKNVTPYRCDKGRVEFQVADAFKTILR